MTNVSGSGASYAVTASTGTGSGTLGLKIPSAGSITDQAGNPLAGTPVNGPAYTVVAPKTALFANDASCSAAGINATGSSDVVNGSTHSNGAYTVTGSSDTFGRLDAGCTPKVTGSGDTFGGLSAPSACLNNEAFPETFSQLTVCAGAAHTGTSISITSGTPSGVYCYTSSISLTASNLTATVTFVAPSISITGSGLTLKPAYQDLLVYGTSTTLGNTGVTLTGSNVTTMHGTVYDPYGKLSLTGSSSSFDGLFEADTITLSGSNLTFTGEGASGTPTSPYTIGVGLHPRRSCRPRRPRGPRRSTSPSPTQTATRCRCRA